MKNKHLMLTSLLLAICSHTPADEWEGHASLLFGQKKLDKDWQSHDSQASGGFITDFKKSDWPVSIAIDIIGGNDDNKKGDLVESDTAELDIGVRKIWQLESLPIQPYLGGGLAFITAEQRRTNDRKQEDEVVGGWLGAGAYWDINDRFNLGVDVRYSRGEVKLYGKDHQAGGLTAGVTLGMHW